MKSGGPGELTAIRDREAFTELHLSFRRSMIIMKPMLAASRLKQEAEINFVNVSVCVSCYLSNSAKIGVLLLLETDYSSRANSRDFTNRVKRCGNLQKH